MSWIFVVALNSRLLLLLKQWCNVSCDRILAPHCTVQQTVFTVHHVAFSLISRSWSAGLKRLCMSVQSVEATHVHKVASTIFSGVVNAQFPPHGTTWPSVCLMLHHITAHDEFSLTFLFVFANRKGSNTRGSSYSTVQWTLKLQTRPGQILAHHLSI